MKYMIKTSKQQGITFIGLIVVLIVFGFFAIIGIKLFPAYTEFSGVKNIIESLSKKPEFANMSESAIRVSFNKSASIGYISEVNGDDLIIGNNESGEKFVAIEYKVTKPIIGNVSVLLDFKASSDKSNLDMLK